MTAVETDRAHIAQAPSLPIDTPPIDAGIHSRLRGTLLDRSTELVDPKYVDTLGEDRVTQIVDEHREFMNGAKVQNYGQILLERRLREAAKNPAESSAPALSETQMTPLFRRDRII